MGRHAGDYPVLRPLPPSVASRIDTRGPDECWPWLGAVNNGGYGVVFLTVDGKRRGFLVHRLVFVSEDGPLDGSLVVDHTCRNRPCQNRRHMEPVTNAENVRRGDQSWNNGNRAKNRCKRGHSLDDAYVYRTGCRGTGVRRQCRPCTVARKAARR